MQNADEFSHPQEDMHKITNEQYKPINEFQILGKERTENRYPLSAHKHPVINTHLYISKERRKLKWKRKMQINLAIMSFSFTQLAPVTAAFAVVDVFPAFPTK